MSQRIALRPGRSQDMAACAGVLNRWIDDTDWMPRLHSPEAVVAHYQTTVFAGRRNLVATADGKVIGFAAMSGDGYVTAFYLDRAYRGRGIGRMIMDQIKVELGDTVSLWTFAANIPAQGFYRAQGFFEINRTDGDNEEGLPDLLLQWQVGASA
jgi:ribosomal protein S18 acetylase RimI-like enzyme